MLVVRTRYPETQTLSAAVSLSNLLDFSRPVLYPAIYPWLVLAAAMDILTTALILHLGGTEVNPVAAGAIAVAGTAGMVVLKFAVIALVLTVCECVGRARHGTGRRLALCSVALNCLPVVVGITELALWGRETALLA